jgi:nucleotide-binding universal stress UspA family protein
VETIVFEIILVPLDGSELAERALPPAMSIARQQQGEIILPSIPGYDMAILPVTAGYGVPPPDPAAEDSIEKVEHYLSGVLQEWAEPEITVRSKVLKGDQAGVILDTAAVEGVGLIVMTSHGYSGFTRWMLGSVTERVLRGAPCPVLLVRNADPIRKAVITLDGSRLAEEALQPGLEVAGLLGCQTTLFRVDQQEQLSSVELGLLEASSSEFCQELVRDNRDRVSYYLECLSERFSLPGQDIETAVVKGKAAECILEYIDEQQIDLVSIATHGYTGLRRWVYGSVTEKVVRNANCAMLIVRPPADSLN